MSKLAKILIPLLATETTQDTFRQRSGFVDLYTYDMDKYKNYRGVYLMFRSDIDTEDSRNRCIQFSRQLGIRKIYTKLINNIPYIIYDFAVPKEIDKIIDSKVCTLNSKQKLQIVRFWGEYDSISDEVLSNICITYNNELYVPEQDIQQSLVEYLNEGILRKKGEAA